MAAEKINWGTKVVNNGSTADGRFSAVEANELHEKFNSHADDIDELVTSITDVNSEITNIQEQITLITEVDLANKTPIPITATEDAPFTISWQTDLVPNDHYGRTYVLRYGNIIRDIINYYEVLGTTNRSYAEFTYTKTGSAIDVVTFPANSLQTGTLAIL